MIRSALVDVLIPVFNAERTVESAVASIQAQTVRDIRMIVVDDGSTDGSGEILARMAAADDRLLVIRQANGGIVDALNAGLARCTAPFIARHDADDLAAPDRFARQIEYLDAYPACIAVDGHYLIIDAADRQIGAQAFAYGPVDFAAGGVPSIEPYLTHPFLMVRREPMLAVGGYRHAWHAEDTDLYWRLLSHGELRHVPLGMGRYRYHSGSISSRSIVNGRIAALGSQLAAVSYRRRAAGRPDISFPRDRHERYVRAVSLEAMLAIACEPLDAAEGEWLRAAVCAKLLELASYRPYCPDHDDAATIAAALDQPDVCVSAGERALIAHNRGVVALKLLARGRWRAGARLHPGLGRTLRAGARQAGLAARTMYGRRFGSPAGN